MKTVMKKIGLITAFLAGIALLTVITIIISAWRFHGLWKMEGYGFCLKAEAGIVRVYEVTEDYTVKISRYDGIIMFGTLYCGLGKFKLEREDKELRMMDEGSRTTYTMKKQKKDYLQGLTKVRVDDPAAKFKMYYQILKENYAFADRYGVDFDEEYAKHSSKVTKDTTDEMLYQYMCNMVENLDDGHVEVSFQDKEYCPSDYVPEWMEDKSRANLLIKVIKENYLEDYYRFDDCYIRYGKLREDIGYIIIQGVGMTELNKARTSKKAMDRIIKEFTDMKTIVIDMRFSPGGYDEAALLLAGYFATDEYLAYNKQTYHNGSFTQLQSVYVKPNKITYGGDIVILTSGYTISAGETFIRDMLANPKHHITVVGQETAGYYSDAIPMILPGDFEFTMSTERYYWYDGTLLEGKGIKPDVEIPFDLQTLQEGKEIVLDWVLENK